MLGNKVMQNAIFISINGSQSGPHSKDELIAMWRQGAASEDAFYWTEGMPNWLPVHDLLGQAPKTTPPPLPRQPPPLPASAINRSKSKNNRDSMAISKRFLPPIPKGYRIYWGDVEVAGIQHCRDEAIYFISGTDQRIEIAAEPSNQYDPHAIAVFGTTIELAGAKKNKIGYIPAEISKMIADQSLFSVIFPRLRNLYLNENGFCVVRIDLVGPK
jgi:hypothetical protein